MNLVRIENVTHQYSERVLLDDVDLLINAGDRIGLLGRNGSGKTTLLRLIAGLETPNSGEIVVWGGVRIQYLPQDPIMDPQLTVLEYVFQAEHLRVVRRYEAISYRLQQNPRDEALQARLADVTAEMDRTNGWAAEADAKAILTRLGIESFDAQLSTLSGGEWRRVALAHVLIDPADLLILDEPTNHIDADTVDWLEEYLFSEPRALLMVTHDRYFLGRVVNQIVELDRRKLIAYHGNYQDYLEARTKRHARLAAAEEKRRKHLARELEWLRRSPMARGTKQKARKQRIEEMAEISYDRNDSRVAIALASRRLGKRVLEARHLSKSFDGDPLFENLDVELAPGERIGIIGPNGAGKSTLLDILAGAVPPDGGTVEWGQTVQLGYYDQRSRGLADEKKVIDFITDAMPLIRSDQGERVEAAQMLEWFLFNRREQQSYVGSLSGGERRRLYLLYVLAQRPNVLFLDEPTNDLDLETLAVLEEFLDAFDGSLVVVSHDRYFLDRNVDFLFSFEEGTLGDRYPTPYAVYREHRESILARQRAGAAPRKEERHPAPQKKRDQGRPRKRTYKEQREMEALEARLAELETRRDGLTAAVNEAGSDYQRLQELAAELEAVKAELDDVEFRWLELAEIGS